MAQKSDGCFERCSKLNWTYILIYAKKQFSSQCGVSVWYDCGQILHVNRYLWKVRDCVERMQYISFVFLLVLNGMGLYEQSRATLIAAFETEKKNRSFYYLHYPEAMHHYF